MYKPKDIALLVGRFQHIHKGRQLPTTKVAGLSK